MKIKCEACGAEYENPTSMICDNCGMRMSRTIRLPVEERVEYVICPECGTRNKENARVCFNCGNLIRIRTS